MSTKAPEAKGEIAGATQSVSGLRGPDLEWICRAVLGATSSTFRGIEISASFYPYIGLTHTIRRKNNKWVIRISDHCRQASRMVLEAIIVILACKILRRRPPKAIVEQYARFRRSSEVEAAVHTRRRQRGRKRINVSEGTYHSLQEIYQEIESRYFNNQVAIGKLGWSPRPSWTRLGHYDPVQHTITISPVLDSPDVPRFVVSYIVYHEMLHVLFEETVAEGRKRHHPPAYRQAERAYPEYLAAKRFLNKYCRTRKRLTIDD